MNETHSQLGVATLGGTPQVLGAGLGPSHLPSSRLQEQQLQNELQQIQHQASLDKPTRSRSIVVGPKGRSGRRKARSRSNSPSPRNQPFDRAQSPHDFRRRLLSGDRPRSHRSRSASTSSDSGATPADIAPAHIDVATFNPATGPVPLVPGAAAPLSLTKEHVSESAEADLARLFSEAETASKNHVPLRCRALPASFWSPRTKSSLSRQSSTEQPPTFGGAHAPIAAAPISAAMDLRQSLGAVAFPSEPPPPSTLLGRTDPVLGAGFKAPHVTGDTPLKAAATTRIPDIIINQAAPPSVSASDTIYDIASGNDLDLFEGLGECLDVELALLGIADDENANIFDDLALSFS